MGGAHERTADATICGDRRVRTSPRSPGYRPKLIIYEPHARGRPSSSHYFVGSQRSPDDQGSYLFYLDPHHTREALAFYKDPNEYTEEELRSCHTRRLRRMHIREMDPSMLIGFLIRDEDDWDSWKSAIKHVQGKAIVTVSAHDPAGGIAFGRESAIDEVETLSDEDADDVLVF